MDLHSQQQEARDSAWLAMAEFGIVEVSGTALGFREIRGRRQET